MCNTQMLVEIYNQLWFQQLHVTNETQISFWLQSPRQVFLIKIENFDFFFNRLFKIGLYFHKTNDNRKYFLDFYVDSP